MMNGKTTMGSFNGITEGQYSHKVFPAWSDLDFHPSRAGAVLVPVIRSMGSVMILFLERQNFLRRHPGEIAFPGGEKEDSDMGPLDTAIRETSEELGVNTGSIQILGSLEPEETIVSNFLVFPFVGILRDVSGIDDLMLAQDEIAGAFLVDPFITTMKLVIREFEHEEMMVRYPEFHLSSGRIIWGLTGKIFSQLLIRMGMDLKQWL